MKKKKAGERLETHQFGEVMLEHLHRYAITLELCRNKVVLDIASGEGYGSNMLANVALKVIGVDISDEAVNAANTRYAKKHNNLEFIRGSADSIPTTPGLFDVVVSFETIEHHDKHREMISEIKRVLKPDGLLVISSPDKLFYSDKKGTTNPFHVKELYKDEFKLLLTDSFKNVELFRQNSFFCSLIVPDNNSKPATKDTKFYQGDYSNVSAINDMESLYLVALASDASFEDIEVSLFIDYTFIKKMLEKSSRYQFGNMVLNPVKYFKEKFTSKKR
jgi:ubiquinone/menaquinone biosynthesis C-methylase UbiE